MTEPGPFRRAAAAAVHCYTAMGCVAAVLALLAAGERRFTTAFLWLFVATMVDYTDGTLSRAIDAPRALPQIDGAAVDSLTDFVANIIAPVVLLIVAGLWPKPEWVWLAVVIIPSLYRFTLTNPHRNAGFFLGIPPVWTFPAFYVYELRLPLYCVMIIVALYGILCFVPFGYVHITRFRRHALRHGAALLAWWAMYLMVTQGWTSRGRALTLLSLLYFVYYTATSLHHYRVYVRSRQTYAFGAVSSNSDDMNA